MHLLVCKLCTGICRTEVSPCLVKAKVVDDLLMARSAFEVSQNPDEGTTLNILMKVILSILGEGIR